MSAILDMGFDTPEPDPTSLSTTTSLPPQEMVETNPGTEPVKETTPTEDNQDVYRRLAEVEAKLRQVEDRNVDLRAQLALAKSSESQKPSTRYEEDLKQMYEQLKYKDNRIIDLNNVIMEKERRIIDLQEACREQGQVAKAKQQAVQIVNKRLQELDGKQMRDAATEVDSSLLQQDRASRKQTAGSLAVSGSDVTSKRNESPGRAIPQFRMSGNGSPPPIDPSEDLSSYTTETLGRSDQLDADLYADPTYSPSAKGLRSKYQRKRVTFDLHQQSQQSPAKKKSSPARASPPVAGNRADADSFLQPLQKQKRPDLAGPQVSNMEDYDYADLVVENNELRRIIAEMEKVTIIPNEVQSESSKDMEVKELKEQLLQLQVEIKVQVLKARAAAQARIKELEATLNGMQCNSAKEMDALLAANEGLKASREWTLNENGKLLKKIDEMKSKMDDLHGELDASLHTNTFFRNRLDEEEKRLENLTQELIQSRRHAQEVAEERQMAQAEAQRLREALFAQDEFISMLEGDLIVYEAHVGILRDSLGASKKEDRQTIKSKAFSAKLNALEMEKKEFAKRNNDERLRVKALSVKIRCLEQERDELKQRLRQIEQEYGVKRSQPVIPTAPVVEHSAPVSRTSSTVLENPAPVRRNSSERQSIEEPMPPVITESLSKKMEPEIIPVLPASEPPKKSVRESELEDEVRNLRLQLDQWMSRENIDQSLRQTELEGELKTLRDQLEQWTERERQLESQCADAYEKLNLLEETKVELEQTLENASGESAQAKEQLMQSQSRISEINTGIRNAVGSVANCLSNLATNVREFSGEKNIFEEFAQGRKEESAEIINVNHLSEILSVVEKTLQKLDDELVKTKSEKDAVKEQLDLAKWAVSEMETVKAELEQQMEQEKSVLEENWQQVKGMLEEKQKELAAAEESRLEMLARLEEAEIKLGAEREENTILRDNKQRLEYRLEEMDKQILEMMVDKEDLEHKLVALQNDNIVLSATLEREKTSLERLVGMMRMEVDRYRVEAELSRTCLEDLRQTANQVAHQQARPLSGDTWLQYQRQAQPRAFSIPPARTYVQNVLERHSPNRSQPPVESRAEESACANIDLAKIGKWDESFASASATFPMPNMAESDEKVLVDESKYSKSMSALEFFQAKSEDNLIHSEAQQRSEQTPVETLESGVQCDLVRQSEEDGERNYASKHLSFRKAPELVRSGSISEKDIELSIIRHPNISFKEPIPEDKCSPQSPISSRIVDPAKVLEENALLLSCVEEAANLEEHMTADVNQLLELNNQLESAVDVLKAEIWSLNNELRKQLTEHEDLLSQLKDSQSENVSLRSELKERNGAVENLKSEFEKKSAQFAQIQREKDTLEEQSAALSEKLLKLQVEHEQLVMKLNQSEHLLTLSQIESQTLAQSLEEKGSILENLKVEFESKAQELLDIQMEKMKIEEESTALNERFLDLRATYEQLLVEKQNVERNDKASELAGHALSTKATETEEESLDLDENNQPKSARLVAKCRDNDSLFRVNAELAHTNVRLQNSLDEMEEKLKILDPNSEDNTEKSEQVVEKLEEIGPESNEPEKSSEPIFSKDLENVQERDENWNEFGSEQPMELVSDKIPEEVDVTSSKPEMFLESEKDENSLLNSMNFLKKEHELPSQSAEIEENEVPDMNAMDHEKDSDLCEEEGTENREQDETENADFGDPWDTDDWGAHDEQSEENPEEHMLNTSRDMQKTVLEVHDTGLEIATSNQDQVDDVPDPWDTEDWAAEDDQIEEDNNEPAEVEPEVHQIEPITASVVPNKAHEPKREEIQNRPISLNVSPKPKTRKVSPEGAKDWSWDDSNWNDSNTPEDEVKEEEQEEERGEGDESWNW